MNISKHYTQNDKLNIPSFPNRAGGYKSANRENKETLKKEKKKKNICIYLSKTKKQIVLNKSFYKSF